MKKFFLALTLMLFSTASFALPIYDSTDDTGDVLWTFDDTAGVATNSLLIEFDEGALGSFANFGIYDGDNPATMANIFTGDDGIFEWAKIEWDSTTHIMELFHSTDGLSYNSLGASIIDEVLFGFYLEVGPDVWYSQTALNSDGLDHLVVVQATADSYGLFWDATGDGTYQDYAVLVDDVLPVAEAPEPGSLMLMGIGLIGTAFGIRRNNRKLKAMRK